jgi:RimJ/RimL family protein N-acetyltransferase
MEKLVSASIEPCGRRIAAIQFLVNMQVLAAPSASSAMMAQCSKRGERIVAREKKLRVCDQKGVHMEETHLWGGTVRKMWMTETEKFRNHLLRLDEHSRKMRFGMAVNDRFIEDYASRISDLQSVVYGCFVEDEMRGAAELRHIGEAWSSDAEAAFSVEEEYQNRGVGAEFLGRIIRAARNRGVGRIYMNCLSENLKMQRLARKYEAELHFDHGEVVGKVIPSSPTYVSLRNEVIDDASGFVMAVLDLPLRLMPAA